MATSTGKFVDFFDMVEQTDWHLRMQRTTIHWVGFAGHEQVLDAGCGAGRMMLRLAQRAKWVTGVDVSGPMIERARHNAEDHEVTNVSYEVGNIRNLPFPDKRFDTVLCMDLFFLLDDPEQALRELIRVCKGNGQVIVVNPAATMNPWTAKTYCEKYRLNDFERDSLLAWATACARRNLVTETQMQELAAATGGELTDTVYLLENMASLFRIVPTPEELADDIEALMEGYVPGGSVDFGPQFAREIPEPHEQVDTGESKDVQESMNLSSEDSDGQL